MLEEVRNKVLESSKRLTDLTLQLEQKNGMNAIQALSQATSCAPLILTINII